MKSGGGENRSDDELSSSSPSGRSATSSSNGGGGGGEEEEEQQQLQLPQQLQQYATFVDRTLKPELQVVEKAAQEVQNEIDDYKELAEKIQHDLMMINKTDTDTDTDAETTTATMTTMVIDLGYGKVRCRARPIQTNDKHGTKKIFVDVGLGFHVEFSTGEAIEFCKRRVEFLSTHKLKRHQQRMIEIKDHILSATNILNELNNSMK
eukprot:CAMPEP_0113472292 /NCGR_PEP_ID=MMETSP0014_2-20120614/17438_1 /TAXON_ID=2857 /ORGANISM="Nitzschia sp." /LENGTH=206 /DNA_ID=CAMNT_0000364993 /DNA_START=20 /DNA_END=640 /DNA_ORIENTATION=- /assembly_acc=CAM_ASM_000159